MVEILQLVHEISSFSQRCPIKGVIWKTSQNAQMQSSECVLSEDILENFAKFTNKHLCQDILESLLKNKVASWNLKLSEEATVDVL